MITLVEQQVAPRKAKIILGHPISRLVSIYPIFCLMIDYQGNLEQIAILPISSAPTFFHCKISTFFAFFRLISVLGVFKIGSLDSFKSR